MTGDGIGIIIRRHPYGGYAMKICLEDGRVSDVTESDREWLNLIAICCYANTYEPEFGITIHPEVLEQ